MMIIIITVIVTIIPIVAAIIITTAIIVITKGMIKTMVITISSDYIYILLSPFFILSKKIFYFVFVNINCFQRIFQASSNIWW